MDNLEPMENQLSVIEESHKISIMSVHENVEKLINDCNEITVIEDDKKSYDKAVELKRIVKQTHVSIEKKRKDLKQPLIDYGKRLDDFVKTIYEPLKKAELTVKSKMEAYELKQEKLKAERKEIEAEIQRKNDIIDSNLRILNGQLEKINLAKNKTELDGIIVYLDSIDLKEFGDRSAEAGFILNQLKMTCTMASRLMVEVKEEKIVEVDKSTLGEPIPLTIPELIINEKPIQSFDWEEPIFDGKNPLYEEPLVADKKPISDGFIDELNQMSAETIEKPLEEPIVVGEKALNVKASDEDVINLIHDVSLDVLQDVLSLIVERSNSVINNSESFKNLDFSEYKELIYSESIKRVAVLINVTK